jgi:hypothetical protein
MQGAMILHFLGYAANLCLVISDMAGLMHTYMMVHNFWCIQITQHLLTFPPIGSHSIQVPSVRFIPTDL